MYQFIYHTPHLHNSESLLDDETHSIEVKLPFSALGAQSCLTEKRFNVKAQTQMCNPICIYSNRLHTVPGPI